MNGLANARSIDRLANTTSTVIKQMAEKCLLSVVDVVVVVAFLQLFVHFSSFFDHNNRLADG